MNLISSMTSIQETNFSRTIEWNTEKIKKIQNWKDKYDDVKYTTEELLEDADKLLYELIEVDIRFENLIMFNDGSTIIKSIDTCDKIMIKALEVFKKDYESKVKDNKLSKIINYAEIYFTIFGNTKVEENYEKLPLINQIIDLVEKEMKNK